MWEHILDQHSLNLLGNFYSTIIFSRIKITPFIVCLKKPSTHHLSFRRLVFVDCLTVHPNSTCFYFKETFWICFRFKFYFGSVATVWKGYHSPEDTFSLNLDSGEYINKVKIYHGILTSSIDSGVWDMLGAITFFTNKGE